MSLGGIAGLIAACAFLLLVGVLAVPLIKLGRVFDESRKTIRDLSEESCRTIKGVTDKTVPLLGEVTTTVTQTNAQLARADAITSNVQSMTSNLAALTGLFAATLGTPVIKVAAFTYGVRRALSGRSRGGSHDPVHAQIEPQHAANVRRRSAG